MSQFNVWLSSESVLSASLNSEYKCLESWVVWSTRWSDALGGVECMMDWIGDLE